MAKRFEFEGDLTFVEDQLGLGNALVQSPDFGPRLNASDLQAFPDFAYFNMFSAFDSKDSPVSATQPVAVFELSSLLAVNGGDGSSGFVINGIDANDYSGHSVASAGDINGDGFDDFVIGANLADPNGNNYAGESYVVFGSNVGFTSSTGLSSLNGTNGFVINGVDAIDHSGYSVAGAGDVNGDGFDDLIIGALIADPNGNLNAGESYVVFGGNALFAASLELSSLNGTIGFVINGIDENDQSGFSVAGAGDINGDGLDDLIIGARAADPNGTTAAGESYVIFGSSAGFPASLNISTLNGTNGFVINGIDSLDQSGSSVAGAGDINGDGFDDLILGAHRADANGESYAGQSYVIFGNNTGFSASLNLSTLNGTNGFVINGKNSGDFSGRSVVGAGDINGDGFDDLVIGANLADPNGNTYAGESYVVFGTNVGFPASLDISSLNGANGFVINGIGAGDLSGYSVAFAGDINGDGFDDLIIGALQADPSNNVNAGESYIVFGSNTGFAASLDLSSLNGMNGFVVNGINSYDYSGRAVSSAGDVNGDGFDDILIGARMADPNGNNNAGQSYIIYGRGDFGRSSEILSENDDTYKTSSSGEAVYALDGDDIIDGSVGSDALHGDEGNDVLRAAGGNDYVAGGTGDDTILGNAGDDNLFGGDGIDLIIGGGGNDTINGDAGDDQLSGQGGDDVINGGDGFDNIAGGAGTDVISGGGDADIINAGGGNDMVNGDEGNDDLSGGLGSDTIFGGAGSDNIYGNNQNDELFGGDGLDVLEGGGGNDLLDGGADVDVLYGGANQDTLLGSDGDDVLFGNSGGDILNGGDGIDTLEGGGGNDTLTGGAGADFFTQNSGFRTDRITDFENGIDVINFSGNSSANSFADVMAAAFQQGSTVRIELNPNNILILESFNLADLDASDFIF